MGATYFAAALALGAFARLCSAQRAWYTWDTERKNFSTFTGYLSWHSVEPGDVFLAMAHKTGCSGGYFGSQFRADGSTSALFSMWDYNETIQSARPAAPNCARFGGEGTGAACGMKYPFEVKREYRFEMSRTLVNASGALWTATVAEKFGRRYILQQTIGSIFIGSAGLQSDCAQLVPKAGAFQEYFKGGDFYSAAEWRGPYLDGDIVAFDALSDCGTKIPSNVSDGGAGRPHVFFQHGRGTHRGCDPSMWQHISQTRQIIRQNLRGATSFQLRAMLFDHTGSEL